jgi:hypothetical protein
LKKRGLVKGREGWSREERAGQGKRGLVKGREGEREKYGYMSV